MAASKTLTKDQRIERARNAGRASHSIEHYVRRVVDRAPELTNEQKDALRAILAPSGGAQSDG